MVVEMSNLEQFDIGDEVYIQPSKYNGFSKVPEVITVIPDYSNEFHLLSCGGFVHVASAEEMQKYKKTGRNLNDKLWELFS